MAEFVQTIDPDLINLQSSCRNPKAIHLQVYGIAQIFYPKLMMGLQSAMQVANIKASILSFSACLDAGHG
jgi:hypothetical protein